MLTMPLLLLHLLFFIEINAEEVAETRYGMEGQSVCLEPRGQPPFESAKWSHEKKTIFSSNKFNPDFKKKINYNKSNFTLCIKSLAKKDNGIYTFSHEVNFTNTYKIYRLKVQAAVPKPALNVTVKQVNSSTDVCILNVNCSVHYHNELHWFPSECNKDGCQSTTATFSHINITISSDNGNLTCTSNNHVSSKEDSREIEELCSSGLKSGPQEATSRFNYLVWIVVVILLVVVLVIILLFVAKFILTGRKNQPRVIQSLPIQQPIQPRISTSSTQADSYENIDSENANENSAREEENDKARTIYCMLDPLPTSEGSEAMDQPHQIHTVYSVIQRPKV